LRTEMPTRARGRSRASSADAGLAFFGLLAFILVVYANPGNWFDGLEDIGFAKIAAGLSLAALGLSWLLYDRRLWVGGVQGWTLLALFALVGLSAAWSFWPKYSFDTFTDGLKYLAIFLLVVNTVDTPARLNTCVRVVALASAIPAFGAIWSHAHGEHLVEGDRAGWIGIFGNPNDLAYHLVVGVALTLAAAASATSRRRRLGWLLLLAPVGYAIFLTQSRAGMMSALVVTLFWLLRSVRNAPIILGAAVILGCLVFVSPHNPWRARTDQATAFGEDMSARGRLDAWRTGINIVKDRPFTGVGAGAFMIAWPEYAPGDAGDVRSEHNTFVQLISELGIPALLLFVGAIVAAAVCAGRAAKQKGAVQAIARGVQCGLVGFAVCSVFGGIAWTWPIYLLLGLAFAARRIGAQEPEPATITVAQAHDYAMAPLPALAGRR
jgi:putative inorganic carbon (HCO3(-)) transporter